jgi:diguanylate cyclase (GGDEF)-like protein
MQDLKKLTMKLNILYVEDEEASRLQLHEVFKLLFHSVDVAVDGLDALEMYKNNSYDIVITDINMPRMNGIELIKEIKKINPTQNIIIISAHNNSEYLLQAIEVGVDSFIIKPLKMQQLNLVLTKVANDIHAQELSSRYNEQLKEEIEEKTAKLAQQFVTDELTGLPNRNALMNKCKDIDQHKVMLLLNIDNFDSINITYGYANGNIILKEIANFLQERVPKDMDLYRVNSNEFALISTSNTLEEMKEFSKNIQNEILLYKIIFDDFSVKTSVTIALAEGEKHLLQNTHIALKEAQKIGKNRIQVYQKDSPIELLQLRIQKYMPKLRRIISNKYVVPYFQPIINNQTNKIEKYECLARVIDENDEIISPLEFIDIAELTGMIPDITRIMIDKSFKIFQKNRYEFSINISEYDLNDGYLREYLAQKLQQYDIDATRVVLEVLEGISAIGAKNSLAQLMNLKDDGFAIAIDDFGVQNSNFERVHSMQVDYIKIDGSFIKNIYKDPKSYNVTKTINDFGKSIGAKIIAEYVHSKEVQDIVLELEIDYSQGFYFSKPLATLQAEEN